MLICDSHYYIDKSLLHSSCESVCIIKYHFNNGIFKTKQDIIKKDNWLRELWFGMPFQNTKDWLIDDEAFWKRWNSQKRLFVVMNENSYQAFAEKAQQTIRQSGRYNDMVWVSNRE